MAPMSPVALVPEEKVSFSLYAYSVSTLTVAKIDPKSLQQTGQQSHRQTGFLCSAILSIYPYIFFSLSGAGLQGQQSKQKRPDFQLSRQFLQLFQGNTSGAVGHAWNTSRRHPSSHPELLLSDRSLSALWFICLSVTRPHTLNFEF